MMKNFEALIYTMRRYLEVNNLFSKIDYKPLSNLLMDYILLRHNEKGQSVVLRIIEAIRSTDDTTSTKGVNLMSEIFNLSSLI